MQKIIIENFRQIKYAEIEIKNILFLIGEQASGKSTIAKLIYFFKTIKQDCFDIIYENPENKGPNIEREIIKKIQDKFRLYFGYTSELSDNFKITYYYSECSNLILYKTNSLQIKFDTHFFNQIVAITKRLSNDNEKFTKDQHGYKATNNYSLLEKSRTNFVQKLNQEIDKLFCDEKSPMFFPAGRNITVSYPEQFQTLFYGDLSSRYTFNNSDAKTVDILLMKGFISFSKFLKDYFSGNNFETLFALESEKESVLDFMLSRYQSILKGKYSNSDGSEQILFENDSNVRVPLNLASSGQQEVIRIIQDIFYIISESSSAFRVIEEPEAHLYPSAQKYLIELLVLMAYKTKSQIIITSHSPYVLATFNNLLYYSKAIEEKPDIIKKIEQYFETTDLNKENNERINMSIEDFQAYSVSLNRDDYCKSVLDLETKLIGDNFLDQETENVNNDFDFIYNLL